VIPDIIFALNAEAGIVMKRVDAIEGFNAKENVKVQ